MGDFAGTIGVKQQFRRFVETKNGRCGSKKIGNEEFEATVGI